MLKIEVLQFNFVRVNTYILIASSGNCVVVDPGCLGMDEEAYMKRYLEERGLTPVGVWLTHQHFDHVFGVSFFVREYGLQPVCMRGDEAWAEYNSVEFKKFAMYTNGVSDVCFSYPIGRYVEEGDELLLDDISFRILHVPGHSQGSMALYCQEEKVCLVGDVLFQMSVGRSDLPGGDERVLIESIKTKLLVLPDDTRVLPGHGGMTTIEIERRANPYLMYL